MSSSSTPADAAEPASGPRPTARAALVLGIAMLVLLLVGWRAYDWFVHDVEQRRAVAEGRAPAPQPAPEPEAGPEEDAPAVPAPGSEPLAPAVRGDAIHRCVRGAEVLFSNQACPPGFTADAGGAAAVPTSAVRAAVLAGTDDPAQRQASCAYLAAEVERLDFEFQQPLPPPILDDISSRLLTLRSQGERLRCVLPKASASGAQPGGRVLDEQAAAAPAAKRR